MNSPAIAITDEPINTTVEMLRTLHRDGKKIPTEVIISGSVLAHQYGADPNPIAGELWIYELKSGWIATLGVAFYRRVAAENGCPVLYAPAESNLGRWQSWEPRTMTPEERAAYGVPSGAQAAICRGARLDQVKPLLQIGVSLFEAIASLARTGTAYIQPQEMKTSDGRDMAPPRGRSWAWVVAKRAEVDLYRKLAVVATSPEPVQTAERTRMLRTIEHQPDNLPEGYGLDEANADLF